MSDIFEEGTEYLKNIDKVLKLHIERIGECRLKNISKQRNSYSHFIGIIIGQKIALSQARKRRSNLYKVLGTDNFNIDEILKLSDNDFKCCDIDNRTRDIIIRSSNYIIDNSLDLSCVSDIKSLQNVSGIGDWTINATLIMTGLDLDCDLSTDYFIKKQIQKLYQLDKLPSISFISSLSTNWKPYCSIAFWYLWQSN